MTTVGRRRRPNRPTLLPATLCARLDIVNFRQTPGGAGLGATAAWQRTQGSQQPLHAAERPDLVELAPFRRYRWYAGWLDSAVFTRRYRAAGESRRLDAQAVRSSLATRCRHRQSCACARRLARPTSRADDVVADVPQATVLTVLSGPTTADGMTWWRNQGKTARRATGDRLASREAARRHAICWRPMWRCRCHRRSSCPPATFRPGDRFRTTTIVRLRKTAGSTNKPAR